MPSAEEILAAITTQGGEVRALKTASTKDTDAIDTAVKKLLSLKAEYKELTGEDPPGAAPKGKSKSKKGKGSSQQPPASSDASNTTSKPAKQAKGVSTLSAAQLARIDAAEREQNALKTALKAVRTRLAVVHQKVELPSAAALERPVALLAVSGSTTSVSSSFSGGRAGGMYDAPFQSVSLGDVQVSNNMYAVPSYYQGQSQPQLPKVATSTYSPPVAGAAGGALDNLEQRQIAIIKQLEALIATTESEIVKRGGSVAGKTQGGVKLGKHGEILPGSDAARAPSAAIEVTISGDPESVLSRAPFAIVELLRSAGKTVNVRQYWHNKNVSAQYLPSAEAMQLFRNAPRGPCDLRVNFIWKNADNCKGSNSRMVVSSSTHVPIEGDSNIAKFLCRAMSPELYPDGDIIQATLIDHYMDQADKLLGSSSRNQKIALKGINTVLGKKPYLIGDTLTLADVYLWSCVATCNPACPSNVKKWRKTVEAHAAFEHADAAAALTTATWP